jgi:Mobilization protein NikA
MKHSPVRRTKLLSIRMDAEEHAAAESMAKRCGFTISDLVRLIVTTESVMDTIERWREEDWLQKPSPADEAEWYKRIRLVTHVVEKARKHQQDLNDILHILMPLYERIQDELENAGFSRR